MDSNTGTSYKLSIRLKPDGFSLSIFDDTNTLLSTKNNHINFAKLNQEQLIYELKQLPESAINYQSTECIIDNTMYSLIPETIFDDTDFAELLKFQHTDFDTAKNLIFQLQLSHFRAKLLFGASRKVITAFQNIFPGLTIKHIISEFAHLLDNNTDGVFVFPEGQNIHTAVVDDHKLTLINSYTFKTNEDILYTLLTILESLNLNSHKVKLILITTEPLSELRSLLLIYIPNATVISTKIG